MRDMTTSPSVATDCDVAPVWLETTQVRALHRACLIVGGVGPLAAHLQVAESALRTWLEGREEPPEDVFLAAVELILLALDQPDKAN